MVREKKNDAEHSWHIALMAVLLQEHAEEEVDLLKVMTMVLIHDLVEIDAEILTHMTAPNSNKESA